MIYLIIASIGIFLFWAYYKIALKSFTRFNLLRFYFISAVILCSTLPLIDDINIDTSRSLENVHEFNAGGFDDLVIEEIIFAKNEVRTFSQSNPIFPWFTWVYLIVIFAISMKVIYTLLKVRAIKKSSERELINGVGYYYNDKIHQPFSLINSIYLPQHWKGQTPIEVIEHELVHINQKHYIDLFLFEITSILLWFNPFIYLLKKEVRLNLEYLADEAVINKGRNICHYQSLLLSIATTGAFQAPLNLYFNISLKNRITMMTKQKSGQFRKLALAGIFPISFALMALNTNREFTAPIKEYIEPIGSTLQNDVPSHSPLGDKNNVKVTSGYGMKIHPITKEEKLHKGIDLRAEEGTPVYATASGIIEIAEFNDEHGNYVQIKHSDIYQTRYSHLKNFIVSSDSQVEKGDVIGYVGNTGLSTAPHLHYEIRKSGEPVDPKTYLNIVEE